MVLQALQLYTNPTLDAQDWSVFTNYLTQSMYMQTQHRSFLQHILEECLTKLIIRKDILMKKLSRFLIWCHESVTGLKGKTKSTKIVLGCKYDSLVSLR